MSSIQMWYRQKVNGVPQYMLSKFNDRVIQFTERFSGDLNTISKSFSLTIKDVRVSDSAVYYCALQPTVTKTHSTLTQKHDTVIDQSSLRTSAQA